MEETIADDEKHVLEIYDSDLCPLAFEIKPRGTLEIRESRKVTKEDLQSDV